MNTNKATKIALKSGVGSSAKDILLSIIGTTISIILTFGTSSLIDHYQEKKSRKLLAMTIIHEIDKDIEQVRQSAIKDMDYHNLCSYVLKNTHQLDKLPKDSLSNVCRSYYDVLPEFSKSNEHIFNSSQNTWSTIDNNIFISNIQEYYKLRERLDRAFKEDTCFLAYIPKEKVVHVERMLEVKKTNGEIVTYVVEDVDYAETIRQRGIYNLEMQSEHRMNWYNTLLRYKSVNEENKILMGISEKDLEEFVKKTADATIVSSDELIGTWIPNSYEIDYWSGGRSNNIFTFHKNNTITVHNYFKSSSLRPGIGDVRLYCTATGEWKIENDSLVVSFPADQIEVKIDDNDFYYTNVSQWQEVQHFIEDTRFMYQGSNLRSFISSLGSDFLARFAPGESCYTTSVSAFIDRLGRSITIRSPRGRERKRFERCDTITIPKYDFVKHSATEKEIIGKWAWFEDANTIQMEFDNRKDHSFTIRKVDKERSADLFDGVMLVTRTISGEWKLENDSVVYYYDTKTLNLSIDDSHITYSADKSSAVNGFKSQLSDIYTQRTLQSPRVAYQAIINAKRTEMIDKDGNVMFLYGGE